MVLQSLWTWAVNHPSLRLASPPLHVCIFLWVLCSGLFVCVANSHRILLKASFSIWSCTLSSRCLCFPSIFYFLHTCDGQAAMARSITEDCGHALASLDAVLGPSLGVFILVPSVLLCPNCQLENFRLILVSSLTLGRSSEPVFLSVSSSGRENPQPSG